MNELVFVYNGNEIGKQDFTAALKSLGVKNDDILFVHSGVSVFGNIVRLGRSFILDSIIEALQEAIPHGTLILPTFTYSFCKGEKYNIKNSKSTVGSLTEHLKKRKVFRGLSTLFFRLVCGVIKTVFLISGRILSIRIQFSANCIKKMLSSFSLEHHFVPVLMCIILSKCMRYPIDT
jgi:aminoglycoside 3-N-acetyltransferase